MGTQTYLPLRREKAYGPLHQSGVPMPGGLMSQDGVSSSPLLGHSGIDGNTQKHITIPSLPAFSQASR